MTVNEYESQELRDSQTEELYRVIGKFVVKFEHVCHSIQIAIIFMLHQAGLQDQKQRVAHVILAGQTAEPLKSLFSSLVAETQSLDDSDKKIVANAVKRFELLTERRNEIIHSTWFIGWGNSETTDFSTATGFKYHKNKQGGAVKSFAKTVDDFSTLIDEASELAQIFHRLNGCFVGGFKVSDTFSTKY
jgi:hypothetical protein